MATKMKKDKSGATSRVDRPVVSTKDIERGSKPAALQYKISSVRTSTKPMSGRKSTRKSARD